MRGETLRVSARDVIDLVPDALLDRLAFETGVDYSVQKLHGKILFKLFLFAILQQGDVSLRVLETIFASQKFQTLFHMKDAVIKHSSIGMRLQNIKSEYFKQIFESLLANPKLKQVCFGDRKIQTHKIDSTFVGIAEKLLTFGLRNGRSGNKTHLKYTVALSGGIPVNIVLQTNKSFISEDIALPPLVKAISENTEDVVNIAIFDQGIRKKKTFIELAERRIFFVSRAESHTFKVVESLLVDTQTDTRFKIISDEIVQFSKKKTHTRIVTFPQQLRLVTGQNAKTGKQFHFITNIRFLTANEIANLYKSRWEIETFFKFIKQELGFTHLVSRTPKGVLAVMYLTMTVAILLTIYKKVNKFSSWKIAKIKFLDELTLDIFKAWHAELDLLFKHKQPFGQADPSM